MGNGKLWLKGRENKAKKAARFTTLKVLDQILQSQ